MPVTPNLSIPLKGDTDTLRPISDWNYIADIVDLYTVETNKAYFGTNVVDGFAPFFFSLEVNINSGSGFANGVPLISSLPLVIILPSTSGTFTVYLSTLDPSVGSCQPLVTSIGTVPITGLPICNVTVSGGVITSLSDVRTYVGTIGSHNHTGGAQGPPINNRGIATLAAIAYSKLNLLGSVVNADISASAAIAYSKLLLTGAVQYADLASKTAKIEIQNQGSTLTSDAAGLDFEGTPVVTTYNGGTKRATVTITPATNTVSGTYTHSLAFGATLSVTVPHANGNWIQQPLPQLTMTGDTATAFIDFGQTFDGTTFTVVITNTQVAGSGIVSFNWTRVGIIA